MKVYYSDVFPVALPDGHRFPIGKYARLRRAIQQAGFIPPDDLQVAPPATDAQLNLAHHEQYLSQVIEGGLPARAVRAIGLPWSPALVERARRSVGGTIAACRSAIAEGMAFNLAGGTHHASSARGQGFCVFNDAAVAARTVQCESQVERIVIIDCDVHQGNGTAQIMEGDPTVFTFSIHGAKNFPFRKTPGDLDIALPDGTGDAEYLQALEEGLTRALAGQPGLAIYLAGSDPHMEDRLGRLALTSDGLAARDRLVFDECWRKRLPVATVMAGGYAPDIDLSVRLHMQTVRLAHEYALRWESSRSEGGLKKAQPGIQARPG